MKKRIVTVLTAGFLYVAFLLAFSFIDSKVTAAEKANKYVSYDSAHGDPLPDLPPPTRPGGTPTS